MKCYTDAKQQVHKILDPLVSLCR